MPNIRWLIRLITIVHRWIYITTRGFLGGGTLGMEFLLLHHVGRRSGRTYITPLLCIETDGGYAIAASNGGDPREPSWWKNLQARPRTHIQHRRRHLDVSVRQAEGEERERLWKALGESYSFFDRYAETAGREIPVVVLEPLAEPVGASGP